MVLGTHLLHRSVLDATLHRILPHVVTNVLSFGDKGVQVFFVISGFVIVLSLGSAPLTRASALLFAVRRQIRLDPVYWVALLATFCGLLIEKLAGFPLANPLPSMWDLVLNALYVGRRNGHQAIISVSWTLAVEIQFYLFTLVLLGVAGFRARQSDHVRRVMLGLLMASGLASLGVSVASGNFDDRSSASVYWVYFALGALIAFAHMKRAQWRYPMALGLAMLVACAFDGAADRPRLLTAVATASVLSLGSLRPMLAAALGRPRILQYLGRRSYSLYLAHDLVVSIVMRAGFKLTGTNAGWALGWMMLAAALSFAATEVLYRYVEKPSVACSNRVKRDGLRALSLCWRRA